MRGYKVAAAMALGLITGALAAAPATAWNRGNVQVLTVLPDLVGQAQSGVKSSAEGLTVGPDGKAEFLAGLDYLVLAMPITPATTGIIGEAALRRLNIRP